MVALATFTYVLASKMRNAQEMKTAYCFLDLILNICFLQSIAQTREPVGYAIIIGANKIDNVYYSSQCHKTYRESDVSGVRFDCDKMKSILIENNYQVTVLSGMQANRGEILKNLKMIGKAVKKNDSFTFYYTGHGDSIKDVNHDEKSGYDQVLVGYNGYVLDDSVYVLLSKYFTTTNNLFIVDACHSGSVYKLFLDFRVEKRRSNGFGFTFNYKSEAALSKSRFSPSSCKYEQTTEINEPFTLIYYGATRDDAQAFGNFYGGYLTSALVQIYANAKLFSYWSNYDYGKFACEIGRLLHWNNQLLQYHEIGPRINDLKKSNPFKIK
jgi:hypothetical protein